MKRLFSAFLVLIVSFSLLSCSSEDEPEASFELSDDGKYIYPESFTSMSAGSAGKLRGKCLGLSIFISRDGYEWTEECIKETLDMLDRASGYIEGISKEFGVSLDIVTTEYDTACVFLCDTEGILFRDFGWTNRIFESTEYGSLEKLLAEKCAADDYDNCFVIFHIIADERSYAVCFDSANTDSDEYFTERCVVFHTHDRGFDYADTEYTYAHEILHLFGAEDLYVPVISEEKNKLLTTLFPNDIMCLGGDIELLSVSPYTAWRIGWTDGLDKNYDFMIK